VERPGEGLVSRCRSVVVGQASEGVAVDRVLVPFADNNDLDQFGADVTVDQPEAFGPVPRQVELDSEEPTEVSRDVAVTERLPRRRPYSTSVAAMRVAPAISVPWSAVSATASLRADAVQLSR
jgi:hypothetical protein